LHRLTVRQNYRRPFGFAINLFGKEARTILGNSREMLTGGLRATIIRRPALLKRVDVTRQVWFSRPDELESFDCHERPDASNNLFNTAAISIRFLIAFSLWERVG
jgi:hypothetical protein